MATKAKAAVPQKLTVQRRELTGTRPIRRMRAQGLVPGVVYGKATEPTSVSVNARDFAKLLHSKIGEHAVVTLRLDDRSWSPPGKPRVPNPTSQGGRHPAPPDKSGAPTAGWEKPVLVKDVQYDPVDGHVAHVDFQAVVLTERLRVKIPVVLKGEAVGVKQDGGILEHFLREVEIECLPTEIPASVEVDVSALKIGDTLHVRDLPPRKNTTMTSDPAGVIASVQKPKEEKPEEATAAPAEPEVIREKKVEEAPSSSEAASSESPPPKKDTKA